MKKLLLVLILVPMGHLIFGQSKTSYSKGLNFATEEELLGIPLASSPYSGNELPGAVDLSSQLPAPGNQGKQSSCVAWATGYALKSYQEKVETKTTLYFSPSFIYNQINNGRDGGSKIIDALNLLSQQGICLLNEMPYNENDYYTQPSINIKNSARKFKIDFWRQVNIRDIKEIKAQLNSGYPVVIGAMVDEGFENINQYNRQSIWNQNIGSKKGGHALLIVGYNDQINAFKIINSWGTNWGNGGYAWIDYNLFPTVVREGYVAKDAINGQSPNNTQDINPVTPIQPTQDLYVTFYSTNVVHNENDPYYGLGMRINGYLTIPRGIGNTYSVVAHFYFSNSTIPVGSNFYPAYSDIYGYAATGTQNYYIGNGVNNNWTVFIPYSAFKINGGYYWGNQYIPQTTYIYAIPTLFIDGFGLAKGSYINFSLNK